MNARQQLARLLPLAMLVLLASIGLRGGISWNGTLDGPLRRYGVIVGIVLEVILGTLLVLTYYRERVADRAGQLRPATEAGDDEADRDIAGTVRTLLRLLLALAMAGVAGAVLVGLHLHTFSKPSSSAPPRLPARLTPRPMAPAGSAGGGAELNIPLRAILYALLVIALLAALVASIWWGRRLSRAAALLPAQPDADGTSEDLREAVASGRAAMAALDDARAAIIACYEAMEQRLAQRGAARDAAGTPDELLRHATDRKIITGTGARRLTTLFYEARFSTHDLGPGTREAAVRALDDLAAELAGSEPEDAAATGATS
jgi:hypothetical protein